METNHNQDTASPQEKVLMKITNLKQYFPLKKTSFRGEQLYVRANDGVSLTIYEGETFGLVGESGCGKSTFGRTLLQLYHQTDGKTMYYGRTLDELAPQYVKDTLTKLDHKRARLRELESKHKALEAEISKLDEKSKTARQDQLAASKRDVDGLLLDLAQLLGGFLALSDAEIGKARTLLLKEYEISHQLVNLNDQLRSLTLNQRDLEAQAEVKKSQGKTAPASNPKLEGKISSLNHQMGEKQKELKAVRKEIQSLRDSYQDNGEFQKYEAYRDDGIDLAKLNYHEMRKLRRDLQLIFQDPYSSLNPRMTVGQIIGEGLIAHQFFKSDNQQTQDYIMKVMQECGLAPYMFHRYPHQFSGGQRQRIGIARSLALRPKFVVCDEAVSALDVSIQSQVINLLQDLKERENLTYLFISHDLSVVKYISDRIGVMYLGNLAELARSEEIFDHPLHPYTEALLSAIPTTDVDRKKETILLEGDIPSPIKPPSGCKFHTRCRYCTDICKQVTPEWTEIRPGHFVACHHPLDHKVEL